MLLLLALSVYLLLALATYSPKDPGWTYMGGARTVENAAGRTGAFFADALFMSFGYLAFLFPLLIGFWGVRVLRERHAGMAGSWPMFSVRLVGFILTMVAGTGLCYMHLAGNGSVLPEDAGGILGKVVGSTALDGFNVLGGTLLLVTLFLIGMTIFTDLSWIRLATTLSALAVTLARKLPVWLQALKARRKTRQVQEQRRLVVEEGKKKAETRKPPAIVKRDGSRPESMKLFWRSGSGRLNESINAKSDSKGSMSVTVFGANAHRRNPLPFSRGVN